MGDGAFEISEAAKNLGVVELGPSSIGGKLPVVEVRDIEEGNRGGRAAEYLAVVFESRMGGRGSGENAVV